MTQENNPTLWKTKLPWPRPEGHKYDRGHALVVAGGMEKSGAAKLAAEAALRVGAGLVTLLCPPEALSAYAETAKSLMLQPVKDQQAFTDFLQDPKRNAIIIGPGNGVSEITRQHVLTALLLHKRVVLDADALTSFKEQPATLYNAVKGNLHVVLTPHEGEFNALFPNLAGTRIERAQAAAKISDAIVVLKGAETIVASPDGRCALNHNAPPTLATAGSGDVLAGIIGGLLASGMQAFDAACAGVWMHGRAAQLFGPGLISEDLPNLLPKVLQELLPSR